MLARVEKEIRVFLITRVGVLGNALMDSCVEGEDGESTPKSCDSTVASSGHVFVTERCPCFEERESCYGMSREESRRMREIDEELQAMGVDETRLFTPPPPPPPPRDTLRQLRMDRESRKREVDLDRRLAAARDAPLVILDDDEVYQGEVLKLLPPPCSSDVAALVARLIASKPEPTPEERAKVKRLTASMRDIIQVAAFARETRRAKRMDKILGEEESSPTGSTGILTSGRPLSSSCSHTTYNDPPASERLAKLSNDLLEASLRTRFAVERGESSSRRGGLLSLDGVLDDDDRQVV